MTWIRHCQKWRHLPPSLPWLDAPGSLSLSLSLLSLIWFVLVISWIISTIDNFASYHKTTNFRSCNSVCSWFSWSPWCSRGTRWTLIITKTQDIFEFEFDSFIAKRIVYKCYILNFKRSQNERVGLNERLQTAQKERMSLTAGLNCIVQ